MPANRDGLLRNAFARASSLFDEAAFALRTLRRTPGYVVLTTGILAWAVGGTTTAVAALDSVVLNPLPYAAERMVLLWRTARGEGNLVTPRVSHAEAWAELTDVFEEIHPFTTDVRTLTGSGEAKVLRLVRIGAGLFDFLGVPPALGRGIASEEVTQEARVAVLSHELWVERYGGDAGVLGRTMVLDGEPWTVIGVMPPRIAPPNWTPGTVGAWLPLTDEASAVQVVARLRPGIDPEAADGRLAEQARRAAETGLGAEVDWQARVFPANEFGREFVGDMLRLLVGGAAVLYLIGCLNVGMLSLQRTMDRDRVYGVQMALGADLGRLSRQIVFEASVVGACAGVLGLLLAHLGLEALAGVRAPLVGRVLQAVTAGAGAAGVAAAAAALGAVLVSIPPMLWLHRRRLDHGRLTRRGSQGTIGGMGARWFLVSSEIALSFALVLGAVLVFGSLRNLQGAGPGFEAEGLGVVRISLPSWQYESEAAREAAFSEMADAIRALPGVTQAVRSDATPTGGGVLVGQLRPDGALPDPQNSFLSGGSVGPGYVALIGQDLLAGRDIEANDLPTASTERAALVSRALARRLYPDVEPVGVVGRLFRFDGDTAYRIVGVVDDLHARGRDVPTLYRALDGSGMEQAIVFRSAGPVRPVLDSVRAAVSALEGDAVLELETATAALSDGVARERITSMLIGLLATTAMTLAIVGLYGVLSRVVGERRGEIGIRLALGADAARIRRMVVRWGVGASSVGLLGGGLFFLVGVRVLATRIFGLEGLTPAAIALAGGILVAAIVPAVILPAERAARVDPGEALE